MNVLFAIAEAHPFAKTGGLGDIGGSLPGALRKHCQIRVIMPKYASIPAEIRKNIRHIIDFKVKLGWREQYCGLQELEYEGLHYYFIDNEYYFKRDRLYGYEDDGERFAFFSLAVLKSLTRLEDFVPDIIHCHDWHTALIPVMLKEFFSSSPHHYPIKSVFTIHNLKYQGIFAFDTLDSLLGLGEKALIRESLEFYGAGNYMKAGLLYADCLTTVSPTYAQEIQQPFFGEKLEGILRMRSNKLYGILNGIDYNIYNPLTDPYLSVNYCSSLSKKAKNKTNFQEVLGLPVREDVPVLAIISRLVEQKGMDLVVHILEELLQMDVQLVILGTGEQKYEELFCRIAVRYPEKAAVRLNFDEPFAHQVYGAADMLLMPSLFEPCGISQMIAMRYGTIPIVRETGGLKDSVIPYNEYSGEGNGFSFPNYNAHELLFTVQRAVRLFTLDKPAWKALIEDARACDFSWEKSALTYQKLYEEISNNKEIS